MTWRVSTILFRQITSNEYRVGSILWPVCAPFFGVKMELMFVVRVRRVVLFVKIVV